ncbi:MAG: hypothetical protein JKY89_03100 [Immundisolibacteraceae bacterium]|nr:hypothetical protein [Immundisolibacteraceae bacterium]
MSFAEQERALFDLVFDAGLRYAFSQQSSAALTDYRLSNSELADFDTIRPDGLLLDAELRTEQILIHFCRQLPVSFSLVCSARAGLSTLKQLINPTIMRSHPDQRATLFGNELRSQLADLNFQSATSLPLATTVLEVELAMVWTGAALKQQLLSDPKPKKTTPSLASGWRNRPVKLADYVGAALLPMPYSNLKAALCPVSDARLWHHLQQQPTPAGLIDELLQQHDPTLFLSRAEISQLNRCEARVNHQTMELNEGFAALLQYIDGSNSVEQILQQLQQVGASSEVTTSIQTGFQKLLESGMIETV